jgi:hypothetical protein
VSGRIASSFNDLLRFRLRSLRFDDFISGEKPARLPGSRFGHLQPHVRAELAFDKVNMAPLPSVPCKKGASSATCALVRG